MKFLKPHILQGAAITVCLWALILSVESKSAIFAFESQDSLIAGIQFAAITLLGAILAALGFTVVGQMKADERPQVRKQAGTVRLIALLFLAFPVWFFGSSVKLTNLEQAYDAYSASPAFAADVALAQQMSLTISERTADDWDIQAAAERTVRPTNANLTPLDGEFWFALILLGLLNFAAEKFRVPAPITTEERLALMYRERGRKAAETKKRRKAAKETRKGFQVVPGKK